MFLHNTLISVVMLSLIACVDVGTSSSKAALPPEPSDNSWNAPIVDEGGDVTTSISVYNASSSRQDQTTLHQLSLSAIREASCKLVLLYRVLTFEPLRFYAPEAQRQDYVITLGGTSEVAYAQRSTPEGRQSEGVQVAEYMLIVSDEIRLAMKDAVASHISIAPVSSPRDNYSFEWPTRQLSERLASTESMCQALKND